MQYGAGLLFSKVSPIEYEKNQLQKMTEKVVLAKVRLLGTEKLSFTLVLLNLVFTVSFLSPFCCR